MKKEDALPNDTTISGERIRLLRKQLNLTQAELAEKLGVKDSAVAKYENGRVTNIKRSVIKKMADLFNVSPSYIMGYSEDDSDKKDKTLKSFDLESIYKAIYLTPSKTGSTKNICGEDWEKALKLYQQYKEAIPQVQNAVDALLKPSQPDS